MNAAFDDERLSAYLDGELSPDERRVLEARLAESAELRQALDELRALGTVVKGLPRHRLDDGFSAGVLRRAELEMLTGRSTDGSATATPLATPAKGGGVSEGRRAFNVRAFNVRALVWTAASIGAAVVLWNHFQTRQDGDDLAREGSREVAVLREKGAVREEGAAKKSEAKDVSGAAEGKRSGGPSSVSGVRTADDSTDDFTATATAARGAPAREKAAEGAERAVVRRDVGGVADETKALAEAAPRSDVKMAEELAELKKTAEPGRAVADAKSLFREPGGPKMAEAMDATLSSRSAAGASGALDAQAAVTQLAQTLTASDSVVVCEITPEAAGSGLVYELLAANSIHPVDRGDAVVDEADDRAAADEKSEKRAKGFGESGGRSNKDQSRGRDEAAKNVQAAVGNAPATDLLEIDATPDQIVGFLAQMRQRPAQVTAVHQMQRANLPLGGADVLRKSVALRGSAGAGAGGKSERDSFEARRSRSGDVPATKSAPVESAPAESAPVASAPAAKKELKLPAADAPAPVESAPQPDAPKSRAVRAPQESKSASLEKEDATKEKWKKDSQVGESSRSTLPAPAAPADAAKPTVRTNEEVRAQSRAANSVERKPGGGGGQAGAGQSADLNQGFYRKFNFQQDNRGGVGQIQRDKSIAEEALPNLADRARPAADALEAAGNRQFARQEANVRQRVIVLIQVRPPVAAAAEAAVPKATVPEAPLPEGAAPPVPAATPAAKE